MILLRQNSYICALCLRVTGSENVDPITVCEGSGTDVCDKCRQTPEGIRLIRRPSHQDANPPHYSPLPASMRTISQARLDAWDYEAWQQDQEDQP